MKLTIKMYDRVNRRKHYRLVRWTLLGDFHLVDAAAPSTGSPMSLSNGSGQALHRSALCGQEFGARPDRYIPEENNDPHVCEECWALFTGAATEVRRLL